MPDHEAKDIFDSSSISPVCYSCTARVSIFRATPMKYSYQKLWPSWPVQAWQIIESYPARLVLLAADVGQGWVPLGPTETKNGQTIAHVLEDPSIQPSFTQEVSSRMFGAQVNYLVIQGTGFSSPFLPNDIALEFDPPLVEGTERMVSCGYSHDFWHQIR